MQASSSLRKSERRVPIYTLSSILLSLSVGVVFAAGHHAFYASLVGSPASDAEYTILSKWSVSKQQINLAIGTAFAFFVKACLAATVSMAYAQLFWASFKRASHAVTLGNVDNAFSALSSPLSILKVWAWRQWPLLFLVALFLWCASLLTNHSTMYADSLNNRLLPLASIIPPATLSVQTAHIEPAPTKHISVANLDFASLNFVNPLVSISSDEFVYGGPSQPVAAVAKVVSSQGDIMPITPPRINTSYVLDFAGPSLACNYVSESEQEQIQNNIATAISTQSPGACQHYGFIGWNTGLGWAGSPPCTDASSLPFELQSNSTAAKLQPHCFSSNSDTPAALYLAFLPNLIQAQSTDGQCFDTNKTGSYFDQAMTMRCDLKNSTYSTSFNYPNGNQEIDISTTITRDYTIEAIGHLQVNSSTADQDCNKFPLNSTSSESDSSSCMPDRELLRILSYQAIMDAFSYIFIGSIYRNPSTQPVDAASDNTVAGSGLTYSVLGHRTDLQYLSSIFTGSAIDDTLFESTFKYDNGTLMSGIYRSIVQDSSTPLNQAVEGLFQKVVISMMSPSQLR